MLNGKDEEIAALHSEMYAITERHAELVTQITQEKELLIDENKDLKRQVSESRL